MRRSRPSLRSCSSDGAAGDPRARKGLAFLAYEEKLLAGSWRFLTYFGRDTLLALRLLLPVLQPRVVEAGLGAVIDRLGPGGDVAHEEAIGELGHLREGLESAVLDYAMVDDDFLLAPLAAAYLLEGKGRARAAAFLERRTPSGESYAAALADNLALVLRLAIPFAAAPSPRLAGGAPGGPRCRATGATARRGWASGACPSTSTRRSSPPRSTRRRASWTARSSTPTRRLGRARRALRARLPRRGRCSSR